MLYTAGDMCPFETTIFSPVWEIIKLYKTAILVEGQGDIWALEESGINIGLGIFGTSLSNYQLIKLESLGVINVIIATDNDVAGITAKYNIIEQLERSYNIITISLSSKDIGDMPRNEIKEIFSPILSKYIKEN